MGHCPQLPPQGDFPFFLSRIMTAMTAATTRPSIAQTMIVPIFAAIQDNISVAPFVFNYRLTSTTVVSLVVSL